MSIIRDDLPLPETPVTTTIFFKGISISIFFKLFVETFFNFIISVFSFLTIFLSNTFFIPLKYSPVKDF